MKLIVSWSQILTTKIQPSPKRGYQTLLVLLAMQAIFTAPTFANGLQTSECDHALVTDTYAVTKERFLDWRLARHVDKGTYEEIKKSAGAHALIYGIPAGANYDEFRDNISRYSEDSHESLTTDDFENIVWTGLDPTAPSTYKTCINALVASSGGLSIVVESATDTEIIVSVRWVPTGTQGASIPITWVTAAKLEGGKKPPNHAIAGSTSLIFVRPTKQTAVVLNSQIVGASNHIILEPLPSPPPKPTTLRITTKLFHCRSTPAELHPHAEITPDAGYKVVGCGARVNYSADGNILTALFPSDQNSCVADAKSHAGLFDPATIDIWAVGLRDPNNDWEVKIFRQSGGPSFQPEATATVSDDFVMTGGGAQDIYGNGYGNMLTASYPIAANSWKAMGTDLSVRDVATITAFAIGIKPRSPNIHLPVIENKSSDSGQPKNFPDQSTSFGPSQNNVLTSGGAWDVGPTNMLTASYPEKDGWRATGKDHAGVWTPSHIIVWILGIRSAPHTGTDAEDKNCAGH